MSCDEQAKAPTELLDKRSLDGFTDRRACPDHRFAATEPPYASVDRRGRSCRGASRAR